MRAVAAAVALVIGAACTSHGSGDTVPVPATSAPAVEAPPPTTNAPANLTDLVRGLDPEWIAVPSGYGWAFLEPFYEFLAGQGLAPTRPFEWPVPICKENATGRPTAVVGLESEVGADGVSIWLDPACTPADDPVPVARMPLWLYSSHPRADEGLTELEIVELFTTGTVDDPSSWAHDSVFAGPGAEHWSFDAAYQLGLGVPGIAAWPGYAIPGSGRPAPADLGSQIDDDRVVLLGQRHLDGDDHAVCLRVDDGCVLPTNGLAYPLALDVWLAAPTAVMQSQLHDVLTHPATAAGLEPVGIDVLSAADQIVVAGQTAGSLPPFGESGSYTLAGIDTGRYRRAPAADRDPVIGTYSVADGRSFTISVHDRDESPLEAGIGAGGRPLPVRFGPSRVWSLPGEGGRSSIGWAIGSGRSMTVSGEGIEIDELVAIATDLRPG